MIGRTIAHYEILEQLGEGGMGVVYKAPDTQLDRFVAIKVLRSDKVSDSGRKGRFVQEAKAASSLNHPNIVTIYEIGADDGSDYIVMEFVSGRTLDRLIPRAGLDPRSRSSTPSRLRMRWRARTRRALSTATSSRATL